MKEHIVKVDTDKCIGCGLCQRDCPVSKIKVVNQKAVAVDQACIKCGHCVAVCPKGSVSITGYNDNPIELKEDVTLKPQDLLLAIQSRRSIRHFKTDKIPSEIINQIIEAGRFTPTAKNSQNVSYVVLDRQKDDMESIAVRIFRRIKCFADLFSKSNRNVDIDRSFFFKNAPVAIVVLSDNKSGSSGDINAALSASNMALVAEANGLGALYSGFYTAVANHSKKLRSAMGINRKDKIATTLVLGYPDVKYRRTAQREPAVVRYR